MSSALDEDTRRALGETRETAGAMLRSAQTDLQKVFVVFLVGFLGAFYALQLYVWDLLKAMTEAQMDAATQGAYSIIAQTPFDVILLQAKISLVTGIILASPVFLYFARDALEERGYWPSAPIPVWKVVVLALVSATLFVLGLLYGYTVFFPFMFAFLAQNALASGFTPTYSIVMWAQFIFLLTLSFGFAAQLPLIITGLSYAEIVPYETFRDKWRHAVVGMFLFGALFTPPDPFTQMMWATPMLMLYGASLYFAKVVVTAKRSREKVDVAATAAAHWNVLAGLAVAGWAAVYLFYTRGGPAAVNELLGWAGSDYRVLAPGSTLGLDPQYAAAAWGLLGGAVALLGGVLYFVYAGLDAPEMARTGDPTAIDLDALDAEGVRAAPPEAFADLSEDEALRHARAAMDDDQPEKAQAIFERFDAAQEAKEAETEADAESTGSAVPGVADDVGDRTNRAAGAFATELTDGDTTEDDIGGYFTDIVFVFDTLTSKSFRIALVFGVTLAVVFGWLYTGGIKDVYEHFLSRLPGQVTPDTINVVALHPMEALVFDVKFSTLVAVIVTLPLVVYYAWPALRDRNVVRGHRRVIFGWTGALVVGLVGGFAIGYLYVAPAVISFLVADAVAANMVIAYRITNFFWLIFFTTAGVGLFADVPVLMVLLNTAGVSYRTMRTRWREVTVGVLTFAAVFTPAGVVSMILVTVPLLFVYGLGLAALFVLTLGGRRDLGRHRSAEA